MNEFETKDSVTALDDIPLFTAFDSSMDAPRSVSGAARQPGGEPEIRVVDERRPFGVYRANQLRDTAAALSSRPVDWSQVVALRKESSAVITEEGQALLSRTGIPLSGDDRLLMGRAIIKRVVGDTSGHCTARAQISGPRRRSRPTSKQLRTRSSATEGCSRCWR